MREAGGPESYVWRGDCLSEEALDGFIKWCVGSAWEHLWPDAEAAIARAKEVFAEFDRQGNTSFKITVLEIIEIAKELIRESDLGWREIADDPSHVEFQQSRAMVRDGNILPPFGVPVSILSDLIRQVDPAADDA